MDVLAYFYKNTWESILNLAESQPKTSEQTAELIEASYCLHTKYHQRRALMLISVAFPEIHAYAFPHVQADPEMEKKIEMMRVKMEMQQGERRLVENRKKHRELLAAIKKCEVARKQPKRLSPRPTP